MVEMTATFLSLTLPGEQAGGAHQEKHCEPRLPGLLPTIRIRWQDPSADFREPTTDRNSGLRLGSSKPANTYSAPFEVLATISLVGV
jgi:hypothetical protein